MQAIRKISDYLDFDPAITQLQSLTSYQYIHADGDDLSIDYLIEDIDDLLSQASAVEELKAILRQEDLALATLITRDFRHTRITARVEYREDTSAHKIEVVQGLYRFIEDENLTSDDYIIHLSGYPVANERFETVTAEDTAVLIPVMIVLMTGIL